MKNIKTIVVTFIITLVLSIGFQTYAAFLFQATPTQGTITQQIQQPKLSDAEQIQKGNKYNVYTGALLVPTDPTEARFRSIEARLAALEAKQK